MTQTTIPIYKVGDLVNQMRRLMEASYPEVWIEGELSSLSSPASGHKYFTLKDDRSQLRCAMFKGRAGINSYKLKEGDLVKVRAKISVYPARGDLQCIVQYAEEAGEGLLQRQFELLKAQLKEQGLFDAEHKQAIPTFAKQIGVITSPTGAAVKDVLTTLKRRCPSIPVTIFPAVVQGDTAADSLINAINMAVQYQQCDVLILTRGGGSLEDLWCFNHDKLAHAIYNCPIPIVSAVGHEVDTSIADLVADYRAPTPTAAAEILSPDRSHLLSRLKNSRSRLKLSFERKIERYSQQVDLTHKHLVHPKEQLTANRQKLVDLRRRLQAGINSKLSNSQQTMKQPELRLRLNSPSLRITTQRKGLSVLSQSLLHAQHDGLKELQHNFASIGAQLDIVSPFATLARGFSIVHDKDNKIVRQASQVNKDEMIKVMLNQGEISCRVDEITLAANQPDS